MTTSATDSSMAGNEPSQPVTTEIVRVIRVLLSPRNVLIVVLLVGSTSCSRTRAPSIGEKAPPQGQIGTKFSRISAGPLSVSVSKATTEHLWCRRTVVPALDAHNAGGRPIFVG